MRLLILPVALTVGLAACGGGGERNPENSLMCGVTMTEQARRVLDQFQARTTVTDSAPNGLEGTLPARVVGYGTGRALSARSDGSVVMGFEGQGFPALPGFAVVLVDDSSEVVRGVLIFENAPPADYPQIGTISSPTSTLALYGMRMNWGRVHEPRCPLFATPRDSTP
jgi:hypothetical protein